MTRIKLTVTGAEAWASVTGILTSGMVGIPVTIEYDEAWDGLTKNLMCRCSPWGSDDGEIRTRLNVGDASTVAHEVMQPDMYLYLGIEGFSSDGTLVIPTAWAKCGKIEYGANTCEDPSTDPELTVWNQIQAEMEQIRQDVITPELVAEIKGYAQSATMAATNAERAKDQSVAASNEALSNAAAARYAADTAQASSDSARTSASSAAYLANETLRLQRAAEAAAERAEAAADSGQNLNLTVEIVTVGEDSGGPVAVTGLSLDLTSYSAKVGGGFYINPVVLPANATNRSVTWQSSKPAVATVNNMGYVECIAEGEAVITCTTVDGGFTATCAVSVAAAESGGGDSGGETTGQKIQFSTLAMTSGFFNADGTVAAIGKTYHVALPYTEGMQISTGTNASWSISAYPPIVVLDGGSYSAYAGTLGNTTVTGSNNAKVTPYTAILNGHSPDATVYVSLFNGSENNSAAALERMDNNDIYWYIPGGES